MFEGRQLLVRLDGAVWDAEGLEQPLSLRLKWLPRPVSTETPRLSGTLLVGLDQDRVDVNGDLELGEHGMLFVRLEGTELGGRSVTLALHSRRLRALRSLVDVSTLSGTLTLSGEAPRAVRLRHDTRRALALRAPSRRSSTR